MGKERQILAITDNTGGDVLKKANELADKLREGAKAMHGDAEFEVFHIEVESDAFMIPRVTVKAKVTVG